MSVLLESLVLDAVRNELRDALTRVQETADSDSVLQALVDRVDSAVQRAFALSRGEVRGKPGDPLHRVAPDPSAPLLPALFGPRHKLTAAIAARSSTSHRWHTLLHLLQKLEAFQRALIDEALAASSVDALALLFAAGQLDTAAPLAADAVTRALAD